jgi:hypothetical protein
MSQLISYIQSNATDCKKAVEPIIGQSNTTIAQGAGDVLTPLFTPVVAGSPAFMGGSLTVKGCADLLVTATFITGSTCEACDNEVLVPVVKTFIVPANSVFPLFGFYSALSVQTINAAGVVTPLVKGTESIFWNSIFVPECDTCSILVP